MPEALQQVRDDLGAQAVILNTRQLRKNNRFNPDDQARVEVTAAFDADAAADPDAGSGFTGEGNPGKDAESAGARTLSIGAGRDQAAQEGSPVRTRGHGAGQRRVGDLVSQRYGVQPPRIPVPPLRLSEDPETAAADRFMNAGPDAPSSNRGEDGAAAHGPKGTVAAVSAPAMEMVAEELRRVHATLQRLERRQERHQPHVPEGLISLRERLLHVGLRGELVDAVTAQLSREMSGKALEDRIRTVERAAGCIARQMPACRDIRLGRQRKIVGFWGAAGAGKTTAMAKIAAGFAARHGPRIVIVCADDRRLGGMEQARGYARIIGIPLVAAYGADDITAALEEHADARLMLIDAAGCGPHDRQTRDDQRRLFAAAQVEEVQVVIDAKNSLEHMLDQIDASEILGERRLLFTKMDETARSGAVLSAAAQSQLPVSYFTTGPDVPGAIEAGNCGRLAARLLGISAAVNRAGR